MDISNNGYDRKKLLKNQIYISQKRMYHIFRNDL